VLAAVFCDEGEGRVAARRARGEQAVLEEALGRADRAALLEVRGGRDEADIEALELVGDEGRVRGRRQGRARGG